MLGPAEITILSDRRVSSPYGLAGGAPGSPGRNTLLDPGDNPRDLGGKASVAAEGGSTICVHTPGGGGHGADEGVPASEDTPAPGESR